MGGFVAFVRLFAGAAVAHEGGEAIERIDLARGDFHDLRLGGVAAGHGPDDPTYGGLIQSAAEPASATCSTTDLGHPGDRRDDDEHDHDEKNEFD